MLYEIDLTKTDRNGAFSCPKCGAVISPADESQNVYSILETKLKGKSLEKLIIQCKCGSEIHLVGFLKL
jgi:transcription initiation factor IIE alpha subunit